MEKFSLTTREVEVLKKALVTFNAADIAKNFDKPDCGHYDEIERLYKKLSDYGGEDE